MSNLILADGKEIQISSGQKIYDAIKEPMGETVKNTVAVRMGDKLVDLGANVQPDTTLVPVFNDDQDVAALEILRHSCSHLLAQAVRQIYGEKVQYTIGPALVNDFKYGFYYDFDLPEPIRLEDLPKIEKLMSKLAKERQFFQRSEVSYDQARETFRQLGQ
ncbi:MAG: threonine--tRNA ligase, partial [Phycisphaerae bacterium]|nr:threonine--tRNA ligase [Phycisphaerae bacterium]